MLANESDPIKRDSMCIPLSAFGRSIDAQIPTNARVYVTGMLGPEGSGQPLVIIIFSDLITRFPALRSPSRWDSRPFTIWPAWCRGAIPPISMNWRRRATISSCSRRRMAAGNPTCSNRLRPSAQARPEPISDSDGIISFLLPLAVALAGTRLVRLLFKELETALSLGELLACGLAVGVFFVTQGILGLRMAGARLEYVLGWAIMLWAAAELVLLFRQRRRQLPPPGVRQLWWLLMIPAALMLWCLFQLAGTEGLLEFDAVAFWALKGKIFYYCAGPELWSWFKNPTLAYAHLDYPLTAPLLHAFTYGTIGHVNEFVTKFWNVWMLLLLGVAILGAGKFPHHQPWLIASVASIVVLLPLTVEFTRAEGGTIPSVFFTVISSLQLALGMAEKQPGRIRLGLLLLMATAMVKFEGIVLLGFWSVLLLLDKDSRTAFSGHCAGSVWPVWLAIAGWIPYLIFRLHHPVPHPESAWLGVFEKKYWKPL